MNTFTCANCAEPIVNTVHPQNIASPPIYVHVRSRAKECHQPSVAVPVVETTNREACDHFYAGYIPRITEGKHAFLHFTYCPKCGSKV